jgi:hypothetical protein
MSLSLRGAHGEVRWEYLPAVTFGPWSYEADGDVPGSGTLHAQVVRCDEFRVQQQPLVVVVPAGRASQWRWSVLDLQISGDTLTARVSRQ